MPVCLHSTYGCLHTERPGLSHCHSDQMATNPKIVAIWSVLYREVCGPYSRAGQQAKPSGRNKVR